MKNLTLLALCLALLLLRASYGQQRLVVFGDSLSDIGNSFALTEGLVPPGPFHGDYGETFDGTRAVFLGRFTDGQNWVDYFPGIAKPFHVDISLLDFAVGGSTSGDLNVIDAALQSFPAQIDAYKNSAGRKNADLCVIWVGANDFAAG